MNLVVFTPIEPADPMRLVFAKFLLLLTGGDIIEVLALRPISSRRFSV